MPATRRSVGRVSDVIECLIAGMPPESKEDTPGGSENVREPGVDGGAEDAGMDVDSPLAALNSPEAGRRPSTAAFWKHNGLLYGAFQGSPEGHLSNGEELSDYLNAGAKEDDMNEGRTGAKEGEDEGERQEEQSDLDEGVKLYLSYSEQGQLDQVLKADRMFYDLLVHDLKECIGEDCWTLDLWKEVFVQEYGWSPEPLLDKYGALVEAAVPAFAAKLDQPEPVVNGQSELPASEVFVQVLREVQTWDWDSATATKAGFLKAYKQKVEHKRSRTRLTTARSDVKLHFHKVR